MNSRPVSVILMALNLGLLGTIGYMAYVMQTSPVTRSEGDGKVLTNTVTQIAVRKVYPTNFLAALGKLPLSWNAIESTNYRVYIANLRAIDCPTETIRDIILTDVAKLYARRRTALRAQAQPYQFWKANGEGWENGGTSPELRKQLQDLEIAADTDDLYFDEKRNRIYISCGAGFIDIIAEETPDSFKALARIKTAPGARTSFYSPDTDCFYLAVPNRGNQKAEIRIFKPQ